jgi:hypothetical protein
MVINQARMSHLVRREKDLIFGFAPLFKWLLALGTALFAALFVRDFGHEEIWLLVACLAVVVIFCLAWPPVFIITDDALMKHTWWRPWTRLPWSNIVQIEENEGGDLYVYCSDGRRLCFTRFHVDPQRFKAEVLKRAKLHGVISSSAPTSLA